LLLPDLEVLNFRILDPLGEKAKPMSAEVFLTWREEEFVPEESEAVVLIETTRWDEVLILGFLSL